MRARDDSPAGPGDIKSKRPPRRLAGWLSRGREREREGKKGRKKSGRGVAMAKALTWTDVPRESAELLLTAPFSPEADEEVIRECMRVEEAAAELESDEPSTATPTRAMTGGATTEEEEAAMAEDITSRREAVLVTMYQEFVSLARSLDFSERKLSHLGTLSAMKQCSARSLP